MTDRTVSALKGLLDNMVHDRNQAMRPQTDAVEGTPVLSVDNLRDDHIVVAHGEQPVLLVESPLPDRLKGATLDVGETPEGPRFVLFSALEAALVADRNDQDTVAFSPQILLNRP